MNKQTYTKVEEARDLFPSPDDDELEKERKLDSVLSQCSCFEHAFIFDENGLALHTQAAQLEDKYVRDEHEHMVESYRTWFSSKAEGKSMVEQINKRT